MSKNIRILIIPDVHGRTFWREPVLDTLQDTDSRIIFLGDYFVIFINTVYRNTDYGKKINKRNLH